MRWRCLLVCLCVLGSTPAWADWVPKLFLKNDCGLNNGFDPTAIQDCEASDIQNMVFSTGGDLVKRSGFAPINVTAIGASLKWTGITFFKLSNQTRFLVATSIDGTTSQIWRMAYQTGTNGPNGVWVDITGATTLGFNVDKHTDFAAAQDKLVITDGQGNSSPVVWTGSGNAATLGGSPPKASWCEYHKNILWLAGDSSNPSRLTFSNIGDITIWTGTDFLNIETNDGQIIRGLKSALDCLYVFKDRSIWRVCGSDRDTFTVEQMVRGIGTLSNDSIQLVNNQFLFLTSDGQVALYDGGISVQIISAKIQGTLNTINRNRLDTAESDAIEDQTGNISYYLSLSSGGSGTNDTVLVYDTFHQAWTKFLGLNANAMSDFEIGTFQKDLLFGDYSGQVHHYPFGQTDNTASINAYYQTKQLTFPDIPQNKTWRLLEVFVNQQGNYNLSVQTRSDFESPGTTTNLSLAGSGATWDNAVFDTDSYADLTTTIGRIEVNKRKRFFQTLFQNNAVSQPVTIKGFLMWMEPEANP